MNALVINYLNKKLYSSSRCKSTKSSRSTKSKQAFKFHVVEYAQHHSICTTARHFGLDRQQGPRHREAVGQYSKMEAQLYDFILDERAAGRCVTGGMIRQEALCLLPETSFQTSIGWLTLVLRFAEIFKINILKFFLKYLDFFS